ncbi:MAG TPA: hypothetical protein VNI78_10210 [Vicinamibacterales bacterium]|nr:hypothetical protein [Vicinamibacterales bacterium]
MRRVIPGVAVILLTAASAAAQATDERWTNWAGCWALVTENLRAEAPASGSVVSRGRTEGVPEESRPRVCVEPLPGAGARFRTTVAGQEVLSQTIVADGADHEVADAECRGTQRAIWSADALRLYSRAQLTCGSDATPRRVSGISMFAPDGTWLDIQAIDVSGQENVRVRRYRRADRPSSRVVASRLTLDAIKEAARHTSPRALEAALVETDAGFDLSSRHVLDLEAAGVPASVIDVIVALSYPERFVVERARADRALTAIADDPFLLGWAFGYPSWSDLYGLSSPFYRYSPYYYSPFAYGYLGAYDPRFFGGTLITDDAGSRSEPRPSGQGRVVDGRGYTRVRPREAEPSEPRATVPISAGGAFSAGGGTSSISPQGYSSGGSGGGGSSSEGGRTAVPR